MKKLAYVIGFGAVAVAGFFAFNTNYAEAATLYSETTSPASTGHDCVASYSGGTHYSCQDPSPDGTSGVVFGGSPTSVTLKLDVGGSGSFCGRVRISNSVIANTYTATAESSFPSAAWESEEVCVNTGANQIVNFPVETGSSFAMGSHGVRLYKSNTNGTDATVQHDSAQWYSPYYMIIYGSPSQNIELSYIAYAPASGTAIQTIQPWSDGVTSTPGVTGWYVDFNGGTSAITSSTPGLVVLQIGTTSSTLPLTFQAYAYVSSTTGYTYGLSVPNWGQVFASGRWYVKAYLYDYASGYWHGELLAESEIGYFDVQPTAYNNPTGGQTPWNGQSVSTSTGAVTGWGGSTQTQNSIDAFITALNCSQYPFIQTYDAYIADFPFFATTTPQRIGCETLALTGKVIGAIFIPGQIVNSNNAIASQLNAMRTVLPFSIYFDSMDAIRNGLRAGASSTSATLSVKLPALDANPANAKTVNVLTSTTLTDNFQLSAYCDAACAEDTKDRLFAWIERFMWAGAAITAIAILL